MNTLQDRVRGVLIGTAIGDSVGLPAEGLSRKRIEELHWKDNWRHRLVFGHGMLSDDTDHSMLVAEALSHHKDATGFQRVLANKFRWWFLSLPAGMGLATGRAIMKLLLMVSPRRSGIYSAGNGPAMRSAIIGAYFADNSEQLSKFVEASTLLTHTDPKALVGVLAVAHCAAMANCPDGVWSKLEALEALEAKEWPVLLKQIRQGLERGISVDDFTIDLGIEEGVSGYIYHTVPVAIFAWLKYHGEPDAFKQTLTAVFNCGGDVDTVGAIAGALAGASNGGTDIPNDWLNGIIDWPRSSRALLKAAEGLSNGRRVRGAFWPVCLVRNLIFLAIVLTHGLLRMLPASALRSR